LKTRQKICLLREPPSSEVAAAFVRLAFTARSDGQARRSRPRVVDYDPAIRIEVLAALEVSSAGRLHHHAAKHHHRQRCRPVSETARVRTWHTPRHPRWSAGSASETSQIYLSRRWREGYQPTKRQFRSSPGRAEPRQPGIALGAKRATSHGLGNRRPDLRANHHLGPPRLRGALCGAS
jgi:hypothetical protein